MNEKVKAFLEEKRKEVEEKKEKKKSEQLISLGLCEKVYSPNNEYSDEYDLYEYGDKTRYYKKVPLEVTDEEFDEIKKFANINGDGETETTNPIATVLVVVAWLIYIGGFILGIVLGNVEISGAYYDYEEFSFAVAIVYWAISFISGTIFLGFSEIIKLLTAIKDK